jgi:hypothetical protein
MAGIRFRGRRSDQQCLTRSTAKLDVRQSVGRRPRSTRQLAPTIRPRRLLLQPAKRTDLAACPRHKATERSRSKDTIKPHGDEPALRTKSSNRETAEERHSTRPPTRSGTAITVHTAPTVHNVWSRSLCGQSARSRVWLKPKNKPAIAPTLPVRTEQQT